MAVKSLFKNSVSVVALTTLLALGGASMFNNEAQAWFGSKDGIHAEDIQPVSDVKIIDEVAPQQVEEVAPIKSFIEETVKVETPAVVVESVAVQEIEKTTLVEDVVGAIADKSSDLVSGDKVDFLDLKSVPTPPAMTSQERAAQLKKELLADIAQAEKLKKDVLDTTDTTSVAPQAVATKIINVPTIAPVKSLTNTVEKVDVIVPSLPKIAIEETILETVKVEQPNVEIPQVETAEVDMPKSALRTLSKQENIVETVKPVDVPRWTKTTTEEQAGSLLSRLEKAKTEKRVLTPIGLSDVDRVMALADAELKGESFNNVVSNKTISPRDIYQVTDVKGSNASGIGLSNGSSVQDIVSQNTLPQDLVSRNIIPDVATSAVDAPSISDAVSSIDANRFMDRANLMNTDLIDIRSVKNVNSVPAVPAIAVLEQKISQQDLSVPDITNNTDLVSRSYIEDRVMEPSVLQTQKLQPVADASVLLSADNLILLPNAEKIVAAQQPVQQAIVAPSLEGQVSSSMLVDDEAMQKIAVVPVMPAANLNAVSSVTSRVISSPTPAYTLNESARELVYQQAIMNATPEVQALGNVNQVTTISRDVPSTMRRLPALGQAFDSRMQAEDMVMVVEGRPTQNNTIMTQAKPDLAVKTKIANNGVIDNGMMDNPILENRVQFAPVSIMPSDLVIDAPTLQVPAVAMAQSPLMDGMYKMNEMPPMAKIAEKTVSPLASQMDSLTQRTVNVPVAAKRQAMSMMALPSMGGDYMGEVASVDAVQRVLGNKAFTPDQSVEPQQQQQFVPQQRAVVADVEPPESMVDDAYGSDLVEYRNINAFDDGSARVQTHMQKPVQAVSPVVSVQQVAVASQSLSPVMRQQKPIRIIVQPEYYMVPAPQAIHQQPRQLQSNQLQPVQRVPLQQQNPVAYQAPQRVMPAANIVTRNRQVPQQVSAQFANLPAYRRPVMYQRGNNVSRDALRNSINKSAEALAKIDFKPSSSSASISDKSDLPFSK